MIQQMNRLYIYLLTLGVFLTATSELIVSGVLSEIAGDMNVTVGAAGQLITAYSLAFAIGTPVLISLTSRLGRKKVMLGSLLVFAAGCGLSFASTHFVLLIASRIILGIGSGVYLVVVFSAAAKLVPAEKVGSAIGTIILGFSLAMVLGVPLGIAITGWIGWRMIFVLLGALSLLIMAAIYRLLPAVEGDEPVSLGRQLRLLGSGVIVSALFITLFRETGNSVMYTYMTPFLQSVLHMNAGGVAVTMLGFGILGVIGSRLGGYAVDRWGAVRILLAGLLVHAAALALLPAFSSWLVPDLILIGVMMFAMFVTAPAIQTYFIQQAPESSDLVLSLNTSVTHLGLAAGAGMGGAVISATSTVLYNPWVAGPVVALGLGAAIVCFFLGRKAYRRLA